MDSRNTEREFRNKAKKRKETLQIQAMLSYL